MDEYLPLEFVGKHKIEKLDEVVIRGDLVNTKTEVIIPVTDNLVDVTYKFSDIGVVRLIWYCKTFGGNKWVVGP